MVCFKGGAPDDNPFQKIWVFFAVTIAIAGCAFDNMTLSPEQRLQERLQKGAETVSACQKTGCTKLSLSFADLEDYGTLSAMTHLTSLEMRYNSFEHLEDILSLHQLSELRIVATRITEVTALAEFEKLKVLHLRSGLAKDIRPTLQKMPELTEIAINLPNDGDISFVQGLPDLDTRFLIGNQVANLNPLKDHQSLVTPRLRVKLPEDKSALLEMPQLRNLEVLKTVTEQGNQGVLEQLKEKGVKVKLTPSVVY